MINDLDEWHYINNRGLVARKTLKKDTLPELQIQDVIKSFGVPFKTDFRFDITGFRQYPFDVAVFKRNGEVAFLVEFDGPLHYDAGMYRVVGNREERNQIHVAKAQFAATKKAEICLELHLPLLRLDNNHLKYLRDILLVWVWRFVDCVNIKNREISTVMMFDKYGWEYEYVPQFERTSLVQSFLDKRALFIAEHGSITNDNWEDCYGDMLDKQVALF